MEPIRYTKINFKQILNINSTIHIYIKKECKAHLLNFLLEDIKFIEKEHEWCFLQKSFKAGLLWEFEWTIWYEIMQWQVWKGTSKHFCFKTQSKSSLVSIIRFLVSSSKSVWSYLNQSYRLQLTITIRLSNFHFFYYFLPT